MTSRTSSAAGAVGNTAMAAPAAPLDPSFPGLPIQMRFEYLTWPELEAALGEAAWGFWQDSVRCGRSRFNPEQKMLEVEIQIVVTAATGPPPAATTKLKMRNTWMGAKHLEWQVVLTRQFDLPTPADP